MPSAPVLLFSGTALQLGAAFPAAVVGTLGTREPSQSGTSQAYRSVTRLVPVFLHKVAVTSASYSKPFGKLGVTCGRGGLRRVWPCSETRWTGGVHAGSQVLCGRTGATWTVMTPAALSEAGWLPDATLRAKGLPGLVHRPGAGPVTRSFRNGEPRPGALATGGQGRPQPYPGPCHGTRKGSKAQQKDFAKHSTFFKAIAQP